MKKNADTCGLRTTKQIHWPILRLRKFYCCELYNIKCSDCPAFNERPGSYKENIQSARNFLRIKDSGLLEASKKIRDFLFKELAAGYCDTRLDKIWNSFCDAIRREEKCLGK